MKTLLTFILLLSVSAFGQTYKSVTNYAAATPGTLTNTDYVMLVSGTNMFRLELTNLISAIRALPNWPPYQNGSVTLTNISQTGAITNISQLATNPYATLFSGESYSNRFTAETTYQNVTNWGGITLNGFTGNTNSGSLTNPTAGMYLVTGNMSFMGSGGGETYEVAALTNGVECGPEFRRKAGSTDVGSAGFNGIVYLPQNCRVSMGIKVADGTPGSIAVLRAGLSVFPMGAGQFFGTNQYSVVDTNGLFESINSRQGGSLILTNLSGTGALTNSTAFQPASATLTNLAGTGALTNSSSYQPANIILTNLSGTGALTNPWTLGASNIFATNVSVRAGQSLSNAVVGGVMFLSVASYTNCCAAPATFTNLNQFSVPAHTLTNTFDQIEFAASGRFANASATTNRLLVLYGATTIFDSGLAIASNRTWQIRGTITRTGNATGFAETQLLWPGAGTAPLLTNTALTIGENNGAANILKLQAGSQRVAVVTQEMFKVEFKPAYR